MTTTTGRSWGIGELARASGITSRTLRHYDAIGLLAPSGTDPGGRRVYDRDGLLRLQQILLLRELGVDLAGIARSLDEDADPHARLRLLHRHLERLLQERDRLDRLATTVRRTIHDLEKGRTMTAEEIFDGFDHREHEAEARERWGEDAVDRGNAAWEGLGAEGRADHAAQSRDVMNGLAAEMRAGTDPASDGPQALVARHHALVSTFWTPDATSFAALGQMYVDDPRFTATYDAVAPGLARYVRDAMAVFARTLPTS